MIEPRVMRAFAHRAQLGHQPGWHLGADPDAAAYGASARKRLWAANTAPCEVDWLDGLRLRLHPDDEASASLFLTGLYEPTELYWFQRFVRPGMTVIDVGGHLGLYTLLAARRVGPQGHVLTLEPSTREYDRIAAHVELNGLKNVRLRQVAAAAAPGEVELHVAAPPHTGHNSLAGFGYAGVGLQGTERVTAETLDRLVEQEGLERVHVIKLDIEGGELAALRGAARTLARDRPALLFEVADRHLRLHGVSRSELCDYLEDFGYQLFAFADATGSLAPAESLDADDANNFVALAPDAVAAAEAEKGLFAPAVITAGPSRPAEASPRPQLSVVAASRNDDHGGSLLHRMQMFVNAFIAQCKRHDLHAELILVEWNPPADRLPLAAALTWPEDCGPCSVRIIEVDPQRHAYFEHADQLPLYQMIAKNVGIRRARGRFVLATNIDLLFSDALMRFMGSRALRPGRVYRADRYDVASDVPPAAPVAEQLAFCEENVLRVNGKMGTRDLRTGEEHRIHSPRWGRTLRALVRRDTAQIKQLWDSPQLHTNGCGDFTLLAREDWWALRGYAELDIFSFHLDSLFCYAAHFSGLREVCLGGEKRTYHIEHSTGSGWTLEGHNALFDRLDTAGIPYLTMDDVTQWVRRMRDLPRPVTMNGEDWGLVREDLAETCITGKAMCRTDGGPPTRGPAQEGTESDQSGPHEAAALSMPLAARCLYRCHEAVAAMADRLRELLGAVDSPAELTLSQALHWAAVALEFRPDLIVVLGRGAGSTTAVCTEIVQRLDNAQCLSLCDRDTWHASTEGRVRALVEPEWFTKLDARITNIVGHDLTAEFDEARRVLLVWDAHGLAVADQVLSRYLPAIADKPHVVLLHDISDSRHAHVPKDYGGGGFWRGMAGAVEGRTPRVNLGWVSSVVDQAIPVLDFCARNGVELHSADHEVHEEIVARPERRARVFEGPLRSVLEPVNHWAYFTLNECPGDPTFPVFLGETFHTGAPS